MKLTPIAAILIAITTKSVSAQQSVSVPYRAEQSWPSASQAYQTQPVPRVQYGQQSYQSQVPQVQPAPHMTQGQYYAIPQTTAQPSAPVATTQVLSTPAVEPTRVLQQSVDQQNDLQQTASNKAPAPAPSIPPQPGDLIVPAPTSIVALPQSDNNDVGTPATSSLVVQPEPVMPMEERVLETRENQEKLATVESVSPLETTTAVVEDRREIEPIIGGQLGDLTGELAATSESSDEITPAVSGIEDSIAPATDIDLANTTPAEVPSTEVPGIEDSTAPATDIDLANITPAEVPSTEVLVEEVVEPAELATTEVEVAVEAKTELSEPRSFNSALEAESDEPTALAVAPFKVDTEQTNAAALASTASKQSRSSTASKQSQSSLKVAPLRSSLEATPLRSNTASKQSQSSTSTSYGNWWLALLPILAIPVIGFLALRKHLKNADVNDFANEALSRVNSKSSNSNPAAESPTQRKKLSAIAKVTSKKSNEDSPSPVQSRLEKLIEDIDQKHTVTETTKTVAEPTTEPVVAVAEPAAVTETAAVATPTPTRTRSELTTSENDFSKCDQFCCIRGIDSATQETLHKAGYVRFSDLEKATQSELELTLSGNDHQFASSDFSRWSSLSALAGKGDWAGFEKLQSSFVSPKVSEVRSEQSVTEPTAAAEDLTKVRGIGPATAELLQDAGITTFKALAEAGTARLQEILDAGGTKFDAIDPSSWCRQAQFQLSGSWGRTQTATLSVDTDGKSESVAPNVKVTTPTYRIAEPTLDVSGTTDNQAPTSTAADRLAEMTGLEQSADTPSQLKQESALLDQINDIRDIATSSAESKVTESILPTDTSKASAE